MMRRYIREFEKQQSDRAIERFDHDAQSAMDSVSVIEAPKYNNSKRQRNRVTNEFLQKIEQ